MARSRDQPGVARRRCEGIGCFRQSSIVRRECLHERCGLHRDAMKCVAASRTRASTAQSDRHDPPRPRVRYPRRTHRNCADFAIIHPRNRAPVAAQHVRVEFRLEPSRRDGSTCEIRVLDQRFASRERQDVIKMEPVARVILNVHQRRDTGFEGVASARNSSADETLYDWRCAHHCRAQSTRVENDIGRNTSSHRRYNASAFRFGHVRDPLSERDFVSRIFDLRAGTGVKISATQRDVGSVIAALHVRPSSVDKLPRVPTTRGESGVTVCIDVPKRPRPVVTKGGLRVDDRDAISNTSSRECSRETEARESRTEDGEAIRRPIADVHRLAAT